MNFWDFFFLMLIWIPLLMLWGFSLLDVFRRDDLPGWSKALWVVVIILVPYLGVIVYLILRRHGATPEEREQPGMTYRQFERVSPSGATPAEQLKMIADLHEAGKLTDAEFAAQKAKILST